MNTNIDYYSEWDEDSAAYCVFDTETGKAHESYASPEQAERRAKEKNIDEKYKRLINNNWMHTGETENGLEIWIKQVIIIDKFTRNKDKYIYIQYILEGERIGTIQQYNIKQIRLINSLIDNL